MPEKVISSFPQKDSFRAQVKFIIGEQLRIWVSSLLGSGVFFFSKTWCLICLLSLELLSNYLREAFVWFPTAIYATFKGMATFPVPAEWNSFPKAPPSPTHPTDLPRKRLSYSVESSVCVLAPACPFQILYLLTRPWVHSLVDHLLIIASTFSKETLAHENLNAALNIQSAFLQEKARIKWLQDGDRNTEFFHRMVNCKKRNSGLHSLFIEGSVCTHRQAPYWWAYC